MNLQRRAERLHRRLGPPVANGLAHDRLDEGKQARGSVEEELVEIIRLHEIEIRSP